MNEPVPCRADPASSVNLIMQSLCLQRACEVDFKAQTHVHFQAEDPGSRRINPRTQCRSGFEKVPSTAPVAKWFIGLCVCVCVCTLTQCHSTLLQTWAQACLTGIQVSCCLEETHLQTAQKTGIENPLCKDLVRAVCAITWGGCSFCLKWCRVPACSAMIHRYQNSKCKGAGLRTLVTMCTPACGSV